MKKYPLFILSISLIACGDSTRSELRGRRIDFEDNNKIELKKENVICQFVALETTDASLFDGIETVEISNDRLFIINQKCDKVLAFDRTGKFIAQIGSYGKGPGEYINPYVLHIDYEKKRISIADRTGSKLLHYRLDNYKYISSQPLFNFTSCAWLNDGNIAWFYQAGFDTGKREKYYIKVTDQNLNKIGYLYPVVFASHYGVYAGQPIYQYNKNVFLNISYLSVIQIINKKSITPAYQISFGSHHMPSLEWLQKIGANDANYAMKLINSEYISSYNIKETDSLLSVYYLVNGGHSYVGFYDKVKNISYKYTTDKFLEITELYGLTSSFGVFNNYFVASIMPNVLKQHEIKRDDLRSLLVNISDEDNPILCLFKINANN